MKEQEPKLKKEKLSQKLALLGGIIGIIALMVESPVAIPAFGLAASGIIFERKSNKANKVN